MLVRCKRQLICNVPLVLAVHQHQGILCYLELPGSKNMSHFHLILFLCFSLLIKMLLLFAKIHNEERMENNLLFHQRVHEGPQSQGLHVVPAYPPHPEVQSLPGSLVGPRVL